jgi:hypothetical protein
MAAEHGARYTHRVRISWAKTCFFALPFWIAMPVTASVTTLIDPVPSITGKAVFAQQKKQLSDARMMWESLSRDVARHPGDFVVFPTEVGAQQFVEKHRDDVERETDPRIIARGVLGYWEQKTIVVLPWRPVNSF